VRILKYLNIFTFLLFAAVFASPTRAQFLGYSSPQSVQVKALNAVTTAQRAIVPNIGQTIHSVTYTISGSCAAPIFDIRISASNDGVTFFAISQDAVDIPFNPLSQAAQSGGVTASGYYPVIAVDLITFNCPTATISAWYSGTSTTLPTNSAIFQQANIGRQTLWQNVPTNTALGSIQISTPFENASGSIWIICSAACPAGMSVTVAALPLVNVVSPTSFALSTLSVSASTGWQRFDITNAPTNVLQLTVTGGGAGNVNWTAIYNFVPASSQVFGGLNVNCVNGCVGTSASVTDPCQSASTLKSSATIGGTINQKVVAGSAGKIVYVCGFTFTLSGAVTQTAQFWSGTQAATPCDTTPVALSGNFTPQNVNNGSSVSSAGGGYTVFQAAAGKDVCLFPNAAGPAQNGFLTYVLQ
jgi:hypothetical protein